MTVITLATVGYREVHPLSPAGLVFTMALIVFGVGGALYLLTRAAELVVDGRLRAGLRRRAMERRFIEGTWQKQRAFSPAVITRGGAVVWVAGHGIHRDKDGRSLAGDFDAVERLVALTPEFDPVYAEILDKDLGGRV